ncbi:EexN family lipoprotein [Methylomonas lenta]|uniref:EexN family lipoprotein n=1 Tax=Methylomonas lenta TaxID=980561 RepID=UPI000AB9BFDC|nr:EexN family lipoprotein [Methylomonas lenta]
MNRTAILLVAAFMLSVMAGCKEEKTDSSAADTPKDSTAQAIQTVETVQTVDWYKAHNTERHSMLTKCHNNPGQLGATPNCINASRADASSVWASRGGAIKVAPLTAADLKQHK